jgi:hypothetical protein
MLRSNTDGISGYTERVRVAGRRHHAGKVALAGRGVAGGLVRRVPGPVRVSPTYVVDGATIATGPSRPALRIGISSRKASGTDRRRRPDFGF